MIYDIFLSIENFRFRLGTKKSLMNSNNGCINIEISYDMEYTTTIIKPGLGAAQKPSPIYSLEL